MPHDRDRAGHPGDCVSVRDRERASARTSRTALRGDAWTARTGLSVPDATMAPARGEMRIFGREDVRLFASIRLVICCAP
jgi:hypothetical protein